MKAARAAEQGKKPSADLLRFQLRRGRRLLDLQRRINSGTWHPGPVKCFTADHPKSREIHEPPFEDRILHHLVVPMLVWRWERKFARSDESRVVKACVSTCTSRRTPFHLK